MKKWMAITTLTLLGIVGCNYDIYRRQEMKDEYAPSGTVVEAIIKMPDGSIEKVKAIRWRLRKTSIAIETEDKEFLTGMNNVVMICEHPKKED